MKTRLFSFLLCALTVVPWIASAGVSPGYLKRDQSVPASNLRVSNHHSFSIREPVHFQLPADLVTNPENLLAVSHSVSGGTVEAHYLPVQVETGAEGEPLNAWIDVQLRAGESRVYTFQDIGGGGSERKPALVAETFPNGLPARFAWQPDLEVELFGLALLEVTNDLDNLAHDRAERIEQVLTNPLTGTFELQDETHGPVKSTFLYEGEVSGKNTYDVQVRYDLFSSGVTNVEIVVTTTNRPASRGYLAVAKMISSPAKEHGALQSNGEIHVPVERNGAPSDRAANWFAWGMLGQSKNQSILVEPTTNPAPRPTVSETFINETVLGTQTGWTMLAEISGASPAGDNQPAFPLPAKDEPVRLNYRLLPAKSRSLDDTNQAFSSFAGYQGRHFSDDEFHVSFGAGEVSFGANYTRLALYGERWSDHKDEVRRDLRIANAMGIDWIRIDDIDSPDPKKDFLTTDAGKPVMDSLQFVAETARETGLKLFLDFSLSPNDARAVAEQFGDVIGFYEMGDALADSLSPDRLQHGREVQEQIVSAHPAALFIVTKNAESFPLVDRLDALDLQLDAIGQRLPESEEISVEAVKNQGTLLGGYATRHGRAPFFSIASWRPEPRQTEEAQANSFYRVSDALLAEGSTSLFLQGDLAPALTRPSTATGAPLRLDRTPTIQAHAFHELVRRYGDEGNRIKSLEITLPLVSIRAGETTTLPVTVRNLTNRPLEVRLSPRLPDGLTTGGKEEILTLRPRQSRSYQRTIEAADGLAPGFYHLFEEAHFEETVRFGWTYASHRAAPAFDRNREPHAGVHYAGGLESWSEINLSNLRHVVFGSEAPEAEVAWAATLQETLRSATGADIQRWSHHEIGEKELKRSLLLIGNQETNPAIAELADRLPIDPLTLDAGEGAIMAIEHPKNPNRFLLIVSGGDADGLEKAATDLLSRYRPAPGDR